MEEGAARCVHPCADAGTRGLPVPDDSTGEPTPTELRGDGSSDDTICALSTSRKSAAKGGLLRGGRTRAPPGLTGVGEADATHHVALGHLDALQDVDGVGRVDALHGPMVEEARRRSPRAEPTASVELESNRESSSRLMRVSKPEQASLASC